MKKKLINPKTIFDATSFGASQAIVDSESSLVYISGQVDWDMQHQVSSDTVAGQLEGAFENLKIVLRESGASVETLLQVRIYIRGEIEDHLEFVMPVVSAFLGNSGPAVTAVGVASLASKATLVEVEVVARVE